jgi:hypothetical protein
MCRKNTETNVILFKTDVDPPEAGSSTEYAREFSGDGARGSRQEEFSDALHVYRHVP